MTISNINPYIENIGKELPCENCEARRISSVVIRADGVFYEVEEKFRGLWECSQYIPVNKILN